MARTRQLDTSQTDVYKFEKIGQELNGHYITTETIQIDGKDVAKHVFSTEKGMIAVLGQAHLTKMLTAGNIPQGAEVWIKLIATKKAKKGMMKVYDLDFDPESLVDVTGLAAAVSAASSAAQEPDYSNDGADEADQNSEQEDEQEQEEAPAPKQAARPAPPASRPPLPGAAAKTNVAGLLAKHRKPSATA